MHSVKAIPYYNTAKRRYLKIKIQPSMGRTEDGEPRYAKTAVVVAAELLREKQ